MTQWMVAILYSKKKNLCYFNLSYDKTFHILKWKITDINFNAGRYISEVDFRELRYGKRLLLIIKATNRSWGHHCSVSLDPTALE